MNLFKKIKAIIVVALSIVLLNSCENLENLNVNGKGFLNTVPEALMTKAQVSYVTFLTNTDPNSNNFRKYVQQWTNTEFADEDNYNQESRNLGLGFWTLYRDVLGELNTAKKLVIAQTVTPDKIAEQKNQIAILDIQMVIVYQSLVDIFGDIPYSEALDFENHPQPKYDDAKTIYLDLANRLTIAINTLDTNSGSFGAGDLFYSGNTSLWKKLGNSVKLKMGMHLADIDAALAKNMVETAYNSGVISNNSENALLNYYSEAGERNPIFAALTTEQHYVPTTYLVDEMKAKNDPRMDIFFDPLSKIGGEYIGFPYAEAGALGKKYADVSNTGPKFRDPTLAGVLFDYAETSFLLADAANRNFNVGATVDTYYVNGITATMEYWGVSNADITTYITRPDVAFATANGTNKEKIAYQLWMAYYNRGFEAWTEYRRLDYPNFVAPATAVAESDGKVPVRNIYSNLEATLNTTNYNSAATAIGGDLMTTKIFWDVN